MLSCTIEEDGKNECNDDGKQPNEENKIQAAQKKKKISLLEISDFLRIKKCLKPRLSNWITPDRRESKPYSFKCNLTNPSINVLLPNSLDIDYQSSGKHKKCPSENIGVRSMNLHETFSGEVFCEFETVAFAEVIKEAVYALEVLERTLYTKGKDDDKSDPERVVVRKKGFCFEANERGMFYGSEAGYLPVVPSIRDKLMNNRTLVYDVLTALACQLEKFGCYDCLRSEINTIIENREKKCSLVSNFSTWVDLAERLQEALQDYEEEFKVQKKEYLEEIERILQEIDASFCINNDKLNYIRRWEASKLEQQKLRQSMEEKAIQDEIKKLRTFRKTEAKVNKELKDYIMHAINNAEADILVWSTRYNDEMEKRQQDITDLKEKIEAFEKLIETSRELQAFRQITVDEYLAEEQKFKDAEFYEQAVNRFAAKIQARWRGYMVRQRLGHYKLLFERYALRRKKLDKKGSKKSKKKDSKKNKEKKSKKK